MQNERGLQSKASDNSRQHWEGGEFPMLCESCLGDNPYLRMQKQTHGGTCKVCDRPFTIFRWRPGRGEGFRKTEICQTCSKIKNICQTCILDLQFGLPSQLRDAVLSQTEGELAVPESEANREYFVSQQLAQIANGNDPWQTGDTPNDKLLKIVRAVAVEREQNKVKLGVIATLGAGGGKRQNSEIYAKTAGEDEGESITGQGKEDGKDINAEDEEEILPPPGMSLEAAKRALNLQESSTPKLKQTSFPKPPKPPGPPPQWAFKKQKTESSTSMTVTATDSPSPVLSS